MNTLGIVIISQRRCSRDVVASGTGLRVVDKRLVTHEAPAWTFAASPLPVATVDRGSTGRVSDGNGIVAGSAGERLEIVADLTSVAIARVRRKKVNQERRL